MDLSTYNDFNPFRTDNSTYSLGVNLTTDENTLARGINFNNGAQNITLHKSGLRHQFVTGEKTKIAIEVGEGGFWWFLREFAVA